MRGGDGAGVGTPRGPHPGRSVQSGGVQLGQQGAAGIGDAAKDGVHHAGEGGEFLGARQIHRGADGGVGGRVQEEEPGGADAQYEADGVGRGAFQVGLEDGVQRAGATQDGGGQPVGGGAVARVAGGETVQGFLEGAMLLEDGAEEGEGEGASRIHEASWRRHRPHDRRAGMIAAPTYRHDSFRQGALQRPRVILVCLCLAMWLPGFFTLPAGDRDESRFAEATKQMVQTGDYVRIMNGTQQRNRKPVGIYWLQVPFVLAADAAGIGTQNPIWPYRMPSLLGGLAAVLATFDVGMRLLRDRRVAMLAGGMLAASALLTVEAHIAKTDAALLGATAWAMAMLARAWMGERLGRGHAVLFWLALGLGILVKGPIAPMIVALTALMLVAWERRAAWLLTLRPAWGVPLMVAVVAPWFIAIELATRGAFLAQSVGGDLGSKLAGGSETHGGFFGEHLLLVPLLAFPSGILVLLALPGAWRRRGWPAYRFLIAWIVPAWLVFEATPTKLPHYPLPVYPALFVLAAGFVGKQGWGSAPSPAGAERPQTPFFKVAAGWVVAGAHAVAAVLLGLGGVAIAVALHGPWWLALPAPPCAAAAAWFAYRRRPWLAIGLAVPLYATILQLTLPEVSALWIGPRVEAALRQDWPAWNARGAGLAVAGYAEPSLVFAAGVDIMLLWNGAAAADVLKQGRASIVLVDSRTEGSFLKEAALVKIEIERVDQVSGFNPSRGRLTTLVFYRRAGR